MKRWCSHLIIKCLLMLLITLALLRLVTTCGNKAIVSVALYEFGLHPITTIVATSSYDCPHPHLPSSSGCWPAVYPGAIASPVFSMWSVFLSRSPFYSFGSRKWSRKTEKDLAVDLGTVTTKAGKENSRITPLRNRPTWRRL